MPPAQSGSDEDRNAIVAVMRQFSRAFNSYDVESFMATWDTEVDRIVYVPEELRYAIFTLDDLRAYFENVPNVVRTHHDIRVIDLEIDVDGDTATVFVRFWSRLAFAKVPEVLDGQIRQSFVLRRRASGWKFVHYHESRQVAGLEHAVGDW